MRPIFPLFQSHLDLTHHYWSALVKEGDTVIDATCGNGRDTLKLCQLAISLDKGEVYAFDVQSEAIHSTLRYISMHLSFEHQKRLHVERRCHSSFPTSLIFASIKLIVYNLGYLPGGNKTYTTRLATTLQSLQQAQELVQPGGVISITCYPGHSEGALEQEGLLDYMKNLPIQTWSCCHHIWINRLQSPSLMLIQRCETYSNPIRV
jgi:hypothetical protein